MTTALVVQPVAETAILLVPRHWLVLPEDWRNGVAFWHVMQAVLAQERVIPYGPPTDIDYTFATKPEQVRAVDLRHVCDECAEAREKAALLLEADKHETICFVQFTQSYVYDVNNIPHEFTTTGPLLSAEVDLG